MYDWYKELISKKGEVESYLVSLLFPATKFNSAGIVYNLFTEAYEDKKPSTDRVIIKPEANFVFYKNNGKLAFDKYELAKKEIINSNKNKDLPYISALKMPFYVLADTMVYTILLDELVSLNKEKKKLEIEPETIKLIELATEVFNNYV